MGDSIVHLNRFRKKILVVIKCLVDVYYSTETFAKELDQEKLDNIATCIDVFDNSVQSLKMTVENLLKEVSGMENDEVDAEKNQEGYIL